MPNDFDKILSDKLKGYEAGFNPADWQKMEAMLPQDSRKFFAVIASLFVLIFLAVGVLMLNNLLNSDGRPVAEQVGELEPGYGGTRYVPDNTEVNTLPQSGGGKMRADADEAEKVVNRKVGSSTKEIPDSTTENQSRSLNQQVVLQDETARTTTSQIAVTENKRKSAKKRNENGKSNLASTRASGNSNSTLILTNTYSNTSAQQTASVPSAAGGSADESAEMLTMLGSGRITAKSTLEDQQVPLPVAKESVFRKKKKMFAFAWGAGAGPVFSFIDPNYLSRPGYTNGLSQEFMFVQRVGLVLSESYAHRKYDGGQYPCPPGLDCPQSYSSSVKSIDFGIDVRANIIHHARWNWYTTAGVIHVVKLKETFEYHYPEIDTVPLPNPHSLSPATNFNGGGQSENFDAITGGLSGAAMEPDLSISGTKRYHIAYRFATGFDVALNSIMKLQFDAGYSFTKRTVGEKNKRLQDIGVNGRMLFLLGK